MPRNRFPDPDPIVQNLLQEEDGTDTEQVVALVGFVGNGRVDPDDPEHPLSEEERTRLRIHADRNLQRWLEVPRRAVVDVQQLEPESVFTRSVVWVCNDAMVEDLFQPDDVTQIANAFNAAGAPYSTWNLIPETRLVTAGLLDLIWYEDDEEGGSYS